MFCSILELEFHRAAMNTAFVNQKFSLSSSCRVNFTFQIPVIIIIIIIIIIIVFYFVFWGLGITMENNDLDIYSHLAPLTCKGNFHKKHLNTIQHKTGTLYTVL
jgi:hypothetical protein